MIITMLTISSINDASRHWYDKLQKMIIANLNKIQQNKLITSIMYDIITAAGTVITIILLIALILEINVRTCYNKYIM